VTQQARNFAMAGALEGVRFLIRDRDAKFTASFDEVFRTEGAKVIQTPIRAPKANAFAERFVRTIRSELLDRTLIVGHRQLASMLREYETHYNTHRPHRGLNLDAPESIDAVHPSVPIKEIRRKGVVGGLINEYGARAA
jgi:putative transposase